MQSFFISGILGKKSPCKYAKIMVSLKDNKWPFIKKSKGIKVILRGVFFE